MLTASVLLAIMGALGAFDIAYFHTRKAKLTSRPECRKEAWVHVVRGLIYTLQFAVVPNLRLTGAWYAALVALFVVDVIVAVLDVLLEPASRRSQGGLPDGEYLAHIVLSVLAGAYLHAVVSSTLDWPSLPTAITVSANAPLALRVLLLGMGVACLGVALFEGVTLWEASLPAPKPIHVAVRLRASAKEVWDLTQDHRLHPSWDHRFSRITMGSASIGTGTRMTYEKTILGFTFRGWGLYKLHRLERQSTFAFGSSERSSLIREGVGLWLYKDVGGSMVDFSTSYTYEVRWGALGRVIDRLVFRPLFQHETERSFRRLAELYFPEGAEPVRGALGRKPAPRVAPSLETARA